MQKFIKLGAVLMLFGALLVAGCGGDDEDSGSDSGEALSAEEYSTQMNELAASFNPDFSAAGAELQTAASPEDYDVGVEELEGLIDGYTSEMEALEPPTEVADIHAEIISIYDELAVAFASLREAVATEDPAEVEAASTEVSATFADVDSRLADLVAEADEAGVDLSAVNQAETP